MPTTDQHGDAPRHGAALPHSLELTAVGGPTLAVRLGTVRLLVDPTFDPPGSYESGAGSGRFLHKTAGPALAPEKLGRVDAVLLSHDQHVDNLDGSGGAVALAAPVVLTTPEAATRLGPPARGLEPWEEVDVRGANGATVRATAVPARHGPAGTEHLTGPVTGFVLTGPGLPTVYVSGDNASMDAVRSVAERFPRVDVAVVFAGGAKSALIGDVFLTFDSARAAEAAAVLGAEVVVPVHFEGWAHFTEGAEALRAAFAAATLDRRLHILVPGRRTVLG